MKEKDQMELEEYGSQDEKQKNKQKKKGWKIALIVLLCTVLALMVGVISAFFYFYNRTNYESDPEVISIDEEKVKEMSLETMDPEVLASILADMSGSDWSYENPVETETELATSEKDVTNPAEESSETIQDSASESAASQEESSSGKQSPTAASETSTRDWDAEESAREATRHWSVDISSQPTYETVPAGQKSNVLNILLLGVDETKAGNSDSMILLSINYTRHTITFTSLMRDIGIQVPGVGFTKLNCAFAVGGGPLAVATVKTNFGIDVDYYAWVSMNAMIEIVDVIGGIDITLTEEEAAYCSVPADEIDGTKVYHLDKNQTVSHCRDRSSGGNDYGRTQRQRNTLMAIINKVRSGSLGSVVSVVNQCLPYVSHNIPAGTVAQLVANSASLINYGINEQRIPYSGMYAGSNGYLIPNLTQTYKTWHTFVYGY